MAERTAGPGLLEAGVFLAELAMIAVLGYVGVTLLLAWAGPVWLAVVFLVLGGGVVIAAERERRPLP